MATTKITSPDLFDLGSLNTALQLPSGTTAERPTSPSTGEWRYNTTTNLVEFWDGGAWRDLQSENIPPIPSENFNTVLYTGDGSATRAITGVGFEPDMVWIKARNGAYSHNLQDSSRGGGSSTALNPNLNLAAGTYGIYGFVSSFDTDGFTVGTGSSNNVHVNNNGTTYVAWCWKAKGGTTSSNTEGTITSTVQANTQAGFSIVQYTGTGSNSTVGHGLSAAPKVVVIKKTSTTDNWQVSISNITGVQGQRVFFNLSQGISTDVNRETAKPSSTVLSVGGQDCASSTTYISYCFAEVNGFSKFDSYTGTGAAGNQQNTGFEPAFVLIKRTDSAGAWSLYDNKRNTTNPRNLKLVPNSDAVENVAGTTYQLNFFTNGFEFLGGGSDLNASGGTFIYMAFAADQSAAPTLADSFDVGIYTGDGTSNRVINTVGFRPDLYWLKTRETSGCTYHNWFDTLRGGNKTIYSNVTSAEVTNQGCGYIQSFDDNGVTYTGDASGINNSGEDFVYWAWKANPVPTINTDGSSQSVVSANQAAGFSIVQYTGTGAAATVGHGLSSTPELVILKNLSVSSNWWTWTKDLGGGDKYLALDSTSGVQTATTIWNGTVPTSTVFSVGVDSGANGSGNIVIAYCFASISGFSKIGIYTGNGSSNSITGLGFQPDFVMIKNTGSGSWLLYDSERTVSVGSNPGTANARPYILTNSDGAENGATSYNVDLDSNGFSMNTSAGDLNTNGGTYIYMAFKENPTPLPLAGNMSFLVVAGGGGAARDSGGGGGAGGLRTSYGASGGGSSSESDITLAAGTYTITVGSGGNITNGTTSSIAGPSLTTISCVGGGVGSGADNSYSAGNGGSGGGASGGSYSNSGGSGTANQGYGGGSSAPLGTGTPYFPGAGGGGASQVGSSVSRNDDSVSGNGGNGLSVGITGSSVFYAGGGSGGIFTGGTAGSGGNGGGGTGSIGGGTSNATDGAANTGGGAGGGSEAGTQGLGGSGVVILRLLTSEYSSSTTGSPTVTTDGNYTVLTYTGSGTYVHS